MDRKSFILHSIGLLALSISQSDCNPNQTIKGKIIGANAKSGHLLRDKTFSEPTTVISKKIVIIGSGISGLSAARQLLDNGQNDIVILDLESNAGGNAKSSQNAVSGFPWGAHYIPIPNNDLAEYLQFLEECSVITGRDEKGLPIYNEFHICFDPEERLYINGRWQDGLIPHYGLPENDRTQVRMFLNEMDNYRNAIGKDGKFAFAIPAHNSSRDAGYISLDNLTMKEWLIRQDFNSTYLHDYVNYCTRDDYGTTYDKSSAWAGIHYFACRKGKGVNVDHSDVLTWPEGNGFLVSKLEKRCKSHLMFNCLATSVRDSKDGLRIEYLEIESGILKAIDAQQCILAVPQFIAARLLGDKERLEKIDEKFHYTPWMVANLTTELMQERSGAPLSWDNVIHGSDSLGYVEATHQSTSQVLPLRNLTYYLPLTSDEPKEARKKALEKNHQDWTKLIFKDLEKVHPDISTKTKEINIMIWGHAMAQPRPGFIHGNLHKQLSTSINNKIHFAHTDLAGISIFEEAFYQGLEAANKIIAQL